MTRADLYRLIDELPESELHAAARFLEFLREAGDPLLRVLEAAPEDDEPLTPEDEAAIEEAWADVRAGRVISDDELGRRLGSVE
jgi:hypothetical protein